MALCYGSEPVYPTTAEHSATYIPNTVSSLTTFMRPLLKIHQVSPESPWTITMYLPGLFTMYLPGLFTMLRQRAGLVAFCDKLKKVMTGEEGGIWAMPEDQTTVDGISTLPQADYLTPMRVECFMKLVSPNLATRAAMIPNTMVEVYPVQGGRAILPFHPSRAVHGIRRVTR